MTVEDIALQMTHGIGVKGAVHLLEVFGDARSIFSASEEELILDGQLRADLAKEILAKKAFADAERELKYCVKNSILPIASTDVDYPLLLRETPDYPHVIYVMGDQKCLSMRCLSLVGTRRATPYGQVMCDHLIGELAARVPSLSVVSGLAFGIDAAAHRAALSHRVPTVAVLANALPQVTPAQHSPLAREILEQGGALVSEMHSRTRNFGKGYLARNRIIAGLSEACVVVESPREGGSLYTASLADGYNRQVMAFPGRANDASSQGTNYLIKKRMASMITSGADLIKELAWDLLPDVAAAMPRVAETRLTEDEERLLALFETTDPVSTEWLMQRSGYDAGLLATLLVGLELAQYVRQLPGNRYMKL